MILFKYKSKIEESYKRRVKGIKIQTPTAQFESHLNA